MKMQQCIDAATDQAMQSHASSSGADCSKRDVQKSATGMTIDSVCTIAGKTTTSHIVVNGSFDSNYTMSITSEGGSLPAARTVTLEAKWLGPCAADQKTRRHDHAERHEDEHPHHAEGRAATGRTRPVIRRFCFSIR